MSKDYYRPIMAIRAVNYVDGDGKVHHHTLQFRREHSENWAEVPALNKPYGSDRDIDIDMAAYDDDEQVQWDQWDHNPFDSYKARIEYLEDKLDEVVRENMRLTSLLEHVTYKVKRSTGSY